MRVLKKKLCLSFTTLVLTLLTQTGIAAQPTLTNPTDLATSSPQQQALIPNAPSLNSKGYILSDAKTGAIVAQKNANTRMEPASLTKLMSLYIIFNAIQSGTIHLDDKVRISKQAWQTGGSRMFIKAGELIPVSQLIQGIVVDSGNDATVALAEYVAGSQSAFVNMMNIQAQRLGMSNSHFVNPTGLPNKKHYTTPMDLSTLAQHVIRDFPDQYHWFAEKWFTYNGIRQPNRNRLLWRYPSVDGLKTGHTQSAGYCLIASAEQGGTRLISVLLGAKTDADRAEQTTQLLTYAFRFYQTSKIFDANTAIKTVRIWKGQENKLAVGVTQPLYITLPVGQASKLSTQFTISDTLEAPIAKGMKVGEVTVSLNKKTVKTTPLYSLATIKEAGFWGRMEDTISLAAHNLFKKKETTTEKAS